MLLCACVGGGGGGEVTSVKILHFKGHVEETESFTASAFALRCYNTENTSVILTGALYFFLSKLSSTAEPFHLIALLAVYERDRFKSVSELCRWEGDVCSQVGGFIDRWE